MNTNFHNSIKNVINEMKIVQTAVLEIDNNTNETEEAMNKYKQVEYKNIKINRYKNSKYKIVNDNEPAEDILKIFETWNISKPKLIVSVTGGAGMFALPSRIKTAFKYGIAKIAESTDALIITGGTQTGVMKLVGEGMAKYYQKDDIKLLGISSWECGMFRDELDAFPSFNETRPHDGYEYNFNVEKVPKGLALLDRNHSHFIIVKNVKNVETLKKTGKAPFGGEIELRNRVEQELRVKNSIPTILIVMNGGKNTIKTVELSSKNMVPVLLISESEGCADLIAKIVTQSKLPNFNIDDYEKDMLAIQIKKEEFVSMKASLLHIVEGAKKKLINVFNFDKGEDLEMSIIRTFLNSRDEKEKMVENLELALKWNKIDIASNDIFNGKEEFTSKDLNKLMEMALIYNRPSFVELLIENKLLLDDFCTPKRLFFLYNSINDKDPRKAPFRNILLRNRGSLARIITFEQVHDFIMKLSEVSVSFLPQDMHEDKENRIKEERLGRLNAFIKAAIEQGTSEITGFDDLKFGEAEKANSGINLFVWAILFNRVEIAKILIQHGESQIMSCLLASLIMDYFKERFRDQGSFAISAEYFENLAISILDLFDKNESDFLNDNLLLNRNPHFSVHILQFSNNTEREKFMATSCAQKVLTEIWNNGILFSFNKKILFSNDLKAVKTLASYLTFGFLAPFFQKFDSQVKMKNILSICCTKPNEVTRFEEDDYVSSHRLVSTEQIRFSMERSEYSIKYQNFMYAPRTHFVYKTGFYIIFLMLYSYLLLCKFEYYDPDTIDLPTNCTNDLSEIANNLTNLTGSQNSWSSGEKTGCREIMGQSWLEYLLCFWVFSFFCQELGQLVQTDEGLSIYDNMEEYFSDGWNQFDMLGIFLFIIGMFLRILSMYFNEEIFIASRIVFCIDLSIYFFRLLQISKRFRALGPTLLMITRMLKDLINFIIIISIFIFAYGITTHAIVFPGTKFDSDLIGSIFNLAYWPIYGDVTFKTLVQERSPEEKPLPSEGIVYGYISTMIYMCIANVLLLNLLIAMFSSTYGDMEHRTDEIWKFENYAIVYEYDKYHNRFPLPPPFNLITTVMDIYGFFLNKYIKKKDAQLVNDLGDKAVIEKEQRYTVIVLKNEALHETQKEQILLKQASDRLKVLDQKSNEVGKISEKLKAVETKLNKTDAIEEKLEKMEKKISDLSEMNEKFIDQLQKFLNAQQTLSVASP